MKLTEGMTRMMLPGANRDGQVDEEETEGDEDNKEIIQVYVPPSSFF
jgi:hypothetical protein